MGWAIQKLILYLFVVLNKKIKCINIIIYIKNKYLNYEPYKKI